MFGIIKDFILVSIFYFDEYERVINKKLICRLLFETMGWKAQFNR